MFSAWIRIAPPPPPPAALGHWLAGAIGLGAGGAIARIIVSVVGAVILIALLRGIGLFR